MDSSITDEIEKSWEEWSGPAKDATFDPWLSPDVATKLYAYGQWARTWYWRAPFETKCFSSLTDWISPAEAAVFHFAGNLKRLLWDTMWEEEGSLYRFAFAYTLSMRKGMNRHYLEYFLQSMIAVNKFFCSWGEDDACRSAVNTFMGSYDFTKDHYDLLKEIDRGTIVRPTQGQVSSLAASLDDSSPWMHCKDSFKRPASNVEVRGKWAMRYAAPVFPWSMILAMAHPFKRRLVAHAEDAFVDLPIGWFEDEVATWVKVRRRIISDAIANNKNLRPIVHDLHSALAELMLTPIGFVSKAAHRRVVSHKLGVWSHSNPIVSRSDYATLGFFIPVEEHAFEELKKHDSSDVDRWVGVKK